MSERTLPNNDAAERAVLGSIFLDRDAIVPLASWLLPEHFYTERHAWIFEAQLACYNRRTPPDLTLVADELRRAGRLDTVGGIPFLIDLSNNVPTSYHVEYYARIVERTALLRQVVRAGGEIARLGFDETEDVDATLEAAERIIFDLGSRRGVRDDADLGEMVDEYADYLSAIQERGPQFLGVPSGFGALDRVTGGFQRSDLLVLAARPGVGKSALALCIAFNMAIHQGRTVGVFSLEMGRMQLLQRMAAIQTGINSQKLRTGRLSDAERVLLLDALGQLSTYKQHLRVDDTAGLSINALRSKARRWVLERGVEFIIVDYLQLVDGRIGGKARDDRRVEVEHVARSLKNLARELNVPILALSQLNRDGASGVPQLHHLREGGIENDPDVVMAIYREDMVKADSDKPGVAEVHFLKHRGGPLDQVDLRYDAATTRFQNLEEYREVPGY